MVHAISQMKSSQRIPYRRASKTYVSLYRVPSPHYNPAVSQQWDDTQRSLKLTMHRNIYGLHAPMRQLMERKIVSYVGP